jgi:hypothetical protein
MRNIKILGLVLATVTLVLTGCLLPGGGVTVTGTVSGDYFDITSDVSLTISREDVSFSVAVPVVSSDSSTQIGAFLVANVPTGEYSVEISFENSYSYASGTMYSVNGGAWTGVDSEVVTGTSAPYTFTITIDSLPVSADETVDIYFGNVG